MSERREFWMGLSVERKAHRLFLLGFLEGPNNEEAKQEAVAIFEGRADGKPFRAFWFYSTDLRQQVLAWFDTFRIDPREARALLFQFGTVLKNVSLGKIE